MKQYKLLIASAGRRVELIQCFRQSASLLGLDLKILACDLEPALSPACHLVDASFKVPRCSSPEYIEFLLDLSKKHAIDLIVPTIDTELYPLARHQSQFEAIGTRILISSPEIIDISNNKLNTYNFCNQYNIQQPQLIQQNQLSDFSIYPVIIKPIFGSASKGIQVVSKMDDMPHAVDFSKQLIQKFVTGPEFTINMYFDRTSKLISMIPHERLEVRAGEVSKGSTSDNQEILQMAAQLSEALQVMGARGAVCFQAIMQHGQSFLIEINARFGGGYPLAHRAGCTFTEWILKEYLLDSTVEPKHGYINHLTMLRYDQSVFVN